MIKGFFNPKKTNKILIYSSNEFLTQLIKILLVTNFQVVDVSINSAKCNKIQCVWIDNIRFAKIN